MADWYQSLAVDCANQAIINRCIAAVHLENANDQFFWEPVLESVKKGPYHFIPHSKNACGQESSGCAQCLKFKGLLNKHFFVCMDSDYRLLGQGDSISASEFYAQTYAYSFENHFCYAQELQKRFSRATLGKTLRHSFDFGVFLTNLEGVVYPILLHYLSMKRDGNNGFSKAEFNKLFQCTFSTDDYQNNGLGIIAKISSRYETLRTTLDTLYSFNLNQESIYYSAMGLNKNNACLRMRGHTLYNFINYIGRAICHSAGINFEEDVLRTPSLTYSGYQEMDDMMSDVRQILL